jgi:uncharacterized protein (DUF1697 family)
MALVVFLRGVNIGGHKTFRPSVIAEKLKHFGTVNIGAAGTFVICRPVARRQLRAEFSRLLPFETEMIICQGREIAGLISRNPFPRQPLQKDQVRFVSILSRLPHPEPSLPVSFPSRGKWLLRIISRENRFVFGLYRRHMRVIRYLGMVDRLFGVPLTTRNWNTIAAITRTLGI